MARDLIYRYDGSFAGLLCCVFESYARREMPADILSPAACQTTLLPEREIETDPEKAGRVARSLPEKLGARAPGFVRRAYLTCLGQKEKRILLFLRLGYRKGPAVMGMLADPAVNALWKAVNFLDRETHQFEGFLRFSDFGGALAAEIEPKNFVLPLLAPHFCERLPGEKFLILDRTHGMAAVYRPRELTMIPADGLELPDPDADERRARELWRLYYRTAEVRGRHNPVCRRSQMPKRYWRCMTEFCRENKKSPAAGLNGGGGVDRRLIGGS